MRVIIPLLRFRCSLARSARSACATLSTEGATSGCETPARTQPPCLRPSHMTIRDG